MRYSKNDAIHSQNLWHLIATQLLSGVHIVMELENLHWRFSIRAGMWLSWRERHGTRRIAAIRPSPRPFPPRAVIHPPSPCPRTGRASPAPPARPPSGPPASCKAGSRPWHLVLPNDGVVHKELEEGRRGVEGRRGLGGVVAPVLLHDDLDAALHKLVVEVGGLTGRSTRDTNRR